MTTATIKLFLVHGDPKRLRTGEISNWTGKAVSAPRTELESLLSRPTSTPLQPTSAKRRYFDNGSNNTRRRNPQGRTLKHIESRN